MDVEIKMPDIGLDEVEIIEVLVQLNDKIELEQALITVEGEKSSMEIPSPVSGIVKHIYIKIGDKIKTNSLIMLFHTQDVLKNQNEDDSHFITKENRSLDSDLKKCSKDNNIIHATPLIRRLSRSLDINLKNIIGTGRKNRILKEDLELYKNSMRLNDLKNKEKHDDFDSNKEEIQEIKLSHLQKITGDNLHQNCMNIPHVTQFDEVDISVLDNFRQKYNSNKKNNDNNITILIFILKVVACALEKFPIFNSFLNQNNTKIILRNYINIGVAVEVPNGLVVPVLKDVNKKNIRELSNELISLSKKARLGKLEPVHTKNGCFTISNLGGIGGQWFSPIVNAPEVAILGISRSQIKPLWNGKQFVPSLMLPLSLSYNHRVINGADGARFITFINKLLSDMHFLFM